jgi:hypothetical protein
VCPFATPHTHSAPSSSHVNSLAAPFINDMAPAGAKSTWLAIFFMCIPSGIALGYVTGGVLFSLTGSWRVPFVVEALLMVRPLPFYRANNRFEFGC